MRQKTKRNIEDQSIVSNRLKEHMNRVNPYERTYFSYDIKNNSVKDGEMFVIERLQHKTKLKSKGSSKFKTVKSGKISSPSSIVRYAKKENR